MILGIKFIIRDGELESWIDSNNIKVNSILNIMKEHLGFKTQKDILNKTGLPYSFTQTKLCWKTDQEFADILNILGGVVSAFDRVKYWYCTGKILLHYINIGGELDFHPYYQCINEGEKKSLIYYTLEKTIERWIREKF